MKQVTVISYILAAIFFFLQCLFIISLSLSGVYPKPNPSPCELPVNIETINILEGVNIN